MQSGKIDPDLSFRIGSVGGFISFYHPMLQQTDSVIGKTGYPTRLMIWKTDVRFVLTLFIKRKASLYWFVPGNDIPTCGKAIHH